MNRGNLRVSPVVTVGEYKQIQNQKQGTYVYYRVILYSRFFKSLTSW